jgi:predicted Fe-Mo cluster-binding NifX family protein
MKILLTVHDKSIAPRFDQATEVIIAEHDGHKLAGDLRTIILSRRGAEDLSDLIVKEGIDCVICGGIEENYYRFFTWKKITVFDGIIGSYSEALQMAFSGTLRSGTILPSALEEC